MDRSSLVFCASAVVLTLLVSALAFPFAARSREDAVASRTPVAAETLGSIDLGPFGTVSVSDLVHYYIDNPPAPAAAAGGAAPKQRFQGC